MKFQNPFNKQNHRRNRQANRPVSGRRTRMETLEDRRVLANYFVFGNGDSIQDAVNDAANDGVDDYIFLKSDTYYQDININDSDSLTIVGLGNVVLRPGNNETMTINNSEDVTLKNLTFRDSDGDDALLVNNTYRLTLYDVQIFDSDFDGLEANSVNTIDIHNSRFNRNGDNGIELNNVGNVYLRDVQASYNGFNNDEDGRNNGVAYINGRGSESQSNGFGTYAGHLEIYSGDYSKNGTDGIYTEGVEKVDIDTIYANDNYEDGVDVEDSSYNYAEELTIHYAATDANGDDGVESNADYVSIDNFRALHNDEAGLDLDGGEEAYIHNADFSYNGGAGLDIDYVEVVEIDYIQAIANGANTENTGLDVDYVDDLKINDSQFIANYGDGIDVYMNDYGETEISWVDSSYNTGNGIDLRYGSATLDGVNTSHNERNGIRSYYLRDLSVNNTSSTYNSYNGLLIEGGNGNGSDYRTDANISWSEFALNYEDGIHADYAGEIILDRVSATYNGDDGFQSFNPDESAEVIDSIFENNFDEDFEEIFF